MTQEERVEQCIEELWRREAYYAKARFAAAEAEHAFKVKLAVEFHKLEGAAETRKQLATIACAAELRTKETTDAHSDIAYQKLMDARDVLGARRSLLKASQERGV